MPRFLLRRVVLVAFLVLPGTLLTAGDNLPDLRNFPLAEARLQRDVAFLASPACEGRGVTTQGINVAADYIAAEFKKAGLKPAGKEGSYYQSFTMSGGVLKGTPRLVLKKGSSETLELKLGKDFQPMGISHSGRLKAPLVFVGYGIINKGKPPAEIKKPPEAKKPGAEIKKPPEGNKPAAPQTSSTDIAIDEYAGQDVAGKVVVILRDTFRVDGKQAVSTNFRRQFGSFTAKLRNAETHKAAGVLFVNDRDTAATGDDLLAFGFTAAASAPFKLPIMQIRRSVLERILGANLEKIERQIDGDLKPRSCSLPNWTAELEIEVQRGALPVKNVVGVLEGSGKLAGETVIVGAHYDHLGFGGGGSIGNFKKMVIHPGADDNASGTAGVMELARRFAARPPQESRRLVFMAFSGEESGLLGASAYTKNPLYPLETTAAMVNLDMIGRMAKDKETGKDGLTAYGTGTAKTFDALIESLNKKHDFRLRKVPTGMGPSDHMSFYSRKIPVFFFFTNVHPDYHRPSDTADKINVPGMRRVVDLTEDLLAQLSTVPQRPEYVSVAGPRRMGGPGGPRLGFRPEIGDDKEGVLLGGVTPGGLAEKAGLKEGDRIVAIGTKPLKNLEEYMGLMQKQKRGDTLDLTLLRAGKKMKFKLKLD